MNNPTYKQGFKVVRQHNKALYSTISTTHKNLDQVRYTTNKPAYPRPNQGPLYVFKTLDDALKFTSQFAFVPNLIIYHCLYKPSTKRKAWYDFNMGSGCIIRIFSHYLPNNTALANMVTITKKVNL